MSARAKATRARMGSWAGAASAIGTPVVIAMTHPMLAGALVGAELVLLGLVVITFMYGSEDQIERIFRLLRLLKGQPEPAPPAVPRPRRRRPQSQLAAAEQVEQLTV